MVFLEGWGGRRAEVTPRFAFYQRVGGWECHSDFAKYKLSKDKKGLNNAIYNTYRGV